MQPVHSLGRLTDHQHSANIIDTIHTNIYIDQRSPETSKQPRIRAVDVKLFRIFHTSLLRSDNRQSEVMSSEVIGQIYDPRGGLQERNGRIVEYIEWKKHDPDEEIDVNYFPHREILGPGYERFHPQMLNLGTMRKGNKAHHDGVDDSAKTKESFFRSPWPAT